MECILCKSPSVAEFSRAHDKLYYKCSECGLIFLDSKYFPSVEEEQERYNSHNNDPGDVRYIEHIKQLTDKMLPYLKDGDTGLDFGSGAGKPVEHILVKNGYNVYSYDPFFFDHKDLLDNKYDFITCIETAEHFHDPAKEFDLISTLLKPAALLGLMTNLFTDEINFDGWWYPRDPTHVCFYSALTIDWLSESYDWDILSLSDNVIVFQSSLT